MIRYTIPNVLKKLREANDAETVSYYENVMIGLYWSSLTILGAIVNIIVLYSRPGSLTDSTCFLAIGIAFFVLSRIIIRRALCTFLMSILSSFILFYIAARFYVIIGPAVWSVAFIQILLAMIKASKTLLYMTIFSIIVCGFFIIRRMILNDYAPLMSLANVASAQVALFVILVVVSVAVHRVGSDRFYRVNQQLDDTIHQKKKIESICEEIKVSEENLKTTLAQLKDTQKQLIQNEKMVAIGQLAAGVAHEINNPLGYVSSNVEFSSDCFFKYKQIIEAYRELIGPIRDVGSDNINMEIQRIKEMEDKFNISYISGEMENIFSDVKDGLTRISEIVLGLKTFSRMDNENQFEYYDLNNGIKNTLLIAKNELKYSARVIEILSPIPEIKAKGNRINQVLLNIILNAVYAIREKQQEGLGTILISTKLENDDIVCQIEDNGTGIDESILKNIFNPFFTTKPTGQGTGLGLSIAYDIVVNEHGGEISAQSEPGAGATFMIKLPLNMAEKAGAYFE